MCISSGDISMVCMKNACTLPGDMPNNHIFIAHGIHGFYFIPHGRVPLSGAVMLLSYHTVESWAVKIQENGS